MSDETSNIKKNQIHRALAYGETPEEAAQMLEFQHSLAIIIGINDYASGIACLKTAANDAHRLAQILADDYQYEVELLVEDVTLDRLRNLLTEQLPARVGENDRVLFYFAGHGIALEGEDGPAGYLIPQDGRSNDRSTFLRMDVLHDTLMKLKCRHMLAILDCCFAGTIRWSTTRALQWVPEIIHQERYERFIRYPAWQIITSAAYDQKALDILSGDVLGERGDKTGCLHSPFALALFQALSGAGDVMPRDQGDGVITASELYLYLRDYVEVKAENVARHFQTPGLWPLKKHDKGEYIFLVPGHTLNLPPAPELTYENNPYRGLQPFEEEHKDLFFGRNVVVEKLAEVAVHHPLTIVLGASGTGKSSLVKAGLAPYLKERDIEHRASGVEGVIGSWIILPPIRPGDSPIRAIETLLRDHLSDADTQFRTQADDPNALNNLTNHWVRTHPRQNLMLIIDQSEELITLCHDDSERLRFVQWLWHSLHLYSDTFHLVLTLRSDFEPQLVSLFKQVGELETVTPSQSKRFPTTNSTPPTPECLVWNRFIIPPMTQAELREAIEGPASARVLYFEPPSLVDHLIDEVIQTPGALPLLSFTLSEMYIKYLERRSDNRALTEEDYEALGGVIGSFRNRASAEYEKLDPAHQATMQRLMLRMVAIEGGELARRRVPRSELVYPAEIENQRVEIILQCLLNARLIVSGESDGENYIEPAHDALVRAWDKLLFWSQEAEEVLPLQRRLTQAATDWAHATKDKQKDLLWYNDPRLPQLHQILEESSRRKGWRGFLGRSWRSLFLSQIFEGQTWLNRRETDFVRQSILQRGQNLRRLVATVIGVILALSTLTIFAFFQRSVAITASNAQATEIVVRTTAQFEAVTAQDLAEERQIAAENAEATAVAERDTAISRQLAIRSSNELASQRGLALLLAVEAGYAADTSEAFNALRQAIVQPGRTLKILPIVGNDEFGISREQVSWSSDGGRILVLGDNRVKAWDVETEKELVTLTPHIGEIQDAKWNTDASQIMTTSSEDGTVRVWDAKTGTNLLTLPGGRGLWNSDESRIMTSGKDGFVRIWDAETGAEMLMVPGDEGSWNSDEDRIMTASFNDGLAHVWDMKSATEISSFTISESSGRIWQREWNAQGSRILTLSDDNVRVWNGETGSELFVLSNKEDKFWQANWNADGTRIVTTGCEVDSLINPLLGICNSSTARVWDAETGSELFALVGETETVWEATWNTEESRILLVSSGRGQIGGTARIWDLETGQVTFFGEGGVTHAIWNRDNTRIITIGCSRKDASDPILCIEGFARVWDVESGDALLSLPSYNGRIWYAKWNSDESRIMTASYDGTVRIWDTQPGTELPLLLNALSLTIDNGQVRVRNTVTEETVILSKPESRILRAKESGDGTRILTITDKGIAQVWDVQTRKEILTLHHNDIEKTGLEDFTVSWNLDETLIATANGEFVRVWDGKTGNELQTLFVSDDSFSSIFPTKVSWDVGGTRIIGAGPGLGVKIWDIKSGDELFTFHSEIEANYAVLNAALNEKGKLSIIAGCAHIGMFLSMNCINGIAQIWDIETKENLLTLSGLGERVDWTAWSPDGSQFLTVIDKNRVDVFDVETGVELFTLSNFSDSIQQAAWNEDGSRIIVESEDKIYQFYTNQEELLLAACQQAIGNMTQTTWNRFMGNQPYRRTCVNLPPASGVPQVIDIEDLEDIVSQVQQILERDPISNPDPKIEAQKLIAPSLIRRGQEAANQDDYEAALAIFQEAVKLDLDLDMDPKAEIQRLKADKISRQSQEIVGEGRDLAERGDLNGALAKFHQAIQLDPQLNLEPAKEAVRLATSAFTQRGGDLAAQGSIERAIVLYNQLRTLDPEFELPLEASNTLCLYGVYWGKGAEVIDYCEQGVEAATADDLGRKRGRRGIARALTGDYGRAVEDLKTYIEWLKEKDLYDDSNLGPRFEAFIETLEAGQNPFDETALAELRKILFGE